MSGQRFAHPPGWRAAIGLLQAWVTPAEIRYFGTRCAMTRWALTLVLSTALGIMMGWIL